MVKTPTPKAVYKIILTFDSQAAAKAFAQRVMSRTPPEGTEGVSCVAEIYPRRKGVK